jgi:HK97 family phage major capsid protein
MYNGILKDLTDQQIKIGKEINDIRAKYDGKEGDLNGSELERFDRMLNDYDALTEQIKVKQDAADKLNRFDSASQKAVGEIERRSSEKGETAVDAKMVFNALGSAMKDSFVGGNRMSDNKFQQELNNFAVANPIKGGYAVVQEVLANFVISLVNDQTFVRRYANVIPVNNADSLGVVTFGDLDDFDWVTENADQSASTESPFGKKELQPRRLSKTIKISKKLIQNAAYAQDLLLNKAAYVFARTQEKAFLTGTGVGRPLGFLFESNDGVSTSRTSSSGTANVISADDIWTVVGLLKSQFRANARWSMHRNTEMRVRKLKAGSNEYLWQPVGTQNVNGLTVGAGATLAGFAYDVSEFMADPGATGNITTGTMVLSLHDLKQGYAIADARQLDITVLDQLYATSDQQGFAMTGYVDGAPVDENAFSRLKIS